MAIETKSLHQEYSADVISEHILPVAYHAIQSRQHDALLRGGQSVAIRDGKIVIFVSPCNSRLNINALHKDGEAKERFMKVFTDFLQDKRIKSSSLDLLYGWIGANNKDDLITPANYENKMYSPKKSKLFRPEEMRLVPGFEELPNTWINDFFTVWGSDCLSININYASREIILGLLPELDQYWEMIADYRKDSAFISIDQLVTEIGLDMETYQDIMPFLTCSFDYVRVSAFIKQGAWISKHRFIIRYNGLGSDEPFNVVTHDIVDRRLRLPSTS